MACYKEELKEKGKVTRSKGRARPVTGHPVSEHLANLLILFRGVCSIFLCVDRSISEIYKTVAFFFNKIILQKVCVYLLLTFSCSQLLYKICHTVSIKNAYL